MATTITRDNLTRLAEQLLAAGQRVIAPAKAADMVVYKAIGSAKEMVAEADYILPEASFKEFLFPRTECVLHYCYDESGKAQTESPDLDKLPAQVVLGCRPCDAASLPMLDKVFGWDYVDPFYFRRREKTTVVSIACSRHGERCYCSSVGLAPDTTAGSDVLLKKAGDRFIAEALTDKGKALLEKFASFFERTDSAPRAEVAELKLAFEVDKVKPWLDAHFENALWSEIAAKCMGCGTCAFGCPTCHCFDIVDEGDLKGGCRLKNWDTCGSALFTVHGSGHNPRSSQEQRYRQRVMHKFKYYLDKFETRACVGCGRCSLRCPVGLDLFDVLQTIAQS
jgi:ferredoxin